METTRRGFFGLVAGAVAAFRSKPVQSVTWQSRWWSAAPLSGRLYFTKVHDPMKWGDEEAWASMNDAMRDLGRHAGQVMDDTYVQTVTKQ